MPLTVTAVMAAGCAFSSIPMAPATGEWPIATKGGRRPLHWASIRSCRLRRLEWRATLQRSYWHAVSTRQCRPVSGFGRSRSAAARMSAENTFETVAREWCENQKDGWTARYHDHVVTRLEADLFPKIGARPIAEVERPELLVALRKVEKPGARNREAAAADRRPNFPIRHPHGQGEPGPFGQP